MTVRAEDKVERGCGYRKAGGLYLVGPPFGQVCDRLPFKIEPCPFCGHVYGFNRGLIKTTPKGIFYCKHKTERVKLASGASVTVRCMCADCPVCNPAEEVAGLMWVGKKFYTPDSFCKEAESLGVCKRIPYMPPWLKVKETRIFLAHAEAVVLMNQNGDSDEQGKLFTRAPGIFRAFIPQAVEQVLNESEATPAIVEDLEKNGIDVVTVPDNDPDHH